MFNCPKCNKEFEKGVRFCSSCGFNIEQGFIYDPLCPICKQAFPPGTQFCKVDGTKLFPKEAFTPKCTKCGKTYSSEVKFCPEDGGQVFAEVFEGGNDGCPTQGLPKDLSDVSLIPIEVNISKYFSHGWAIFQKNLWSFMGYTFLLVIIFGFLTYFLPFSLAGGSNDSWKYEWRVRRAFQDYQFQFGILSLLIGQVAISGYIVVVKKLTRKEPVSFSDLFPPSKSIFPILGAAILINLLSFIGLIFFILPGLFFGTNFLFAYPLIVDRNYGPIDAMNKSGKIVRRSFFWMFLFTIPLCLLNVLGAIPYGLGVIFTVPLTLCVWLACYNDLVGFAFEK